MSLQAFDAIVWLSSFIKDEIWKRSHYESMGARMWCWVFIGRRFGLIYIIEKFWDSLTFVFLTSYRKLIKRKNLLIYFTFRKTFSMENNKKFKIIVFVLIKRWKLILWPQCQNYFLVARTRINLKRRKNEFTGDR